MNRAYLSPLTAILLMALVALTAACDDYGQPRTLSFPDFDGRKVFPSAAPQQGPGDQASGFENRVQNLMDGEDGAQEAPTGAVQTISLGSSLVSEIPDDFETWRWSRRQNLTLISMIPPGESAQVVIVARQFPITAANSPSRSFRTFLGDVDPGMGDGFDLRQLMELAGTDGLSLSGLVEGQDIPIDDLLTALQGANTMTGGRGLGYRSAEGTFSGWRWIGHNPEGATLRLAASQGNWGPQPELPPGLDPGSLQFLVEAAGGQDIDMSDVDFPLANIPHRRATMHVGQAETSPDRGVYLAILCAAEGPCPLARELATFVNRIRTADAAPPPSGRSIDFDEHARLLGIHFQD